MKKEEKKKDWNELAEDYKAKLLSGETIKIRPMGKSMEPLIFSGNLVTVEPFPPAEIKVGDIVFCKVKENFYIHLVQKITQKMGGLLFQIGNNKNYTNGTIFESELYGKVTQVGE